LARARERASEAARGKERSRPTVVASSSRRRRVIETPRADGDFARLSLSHPPTRQGTTSSREIVVVAVVDWFF
jgi:hypothetical protein